MTRWEKEKSKNISTAKKKVKYFVLINYLVSWLSGLERSYAKSPVAYDGPSNYQRQVALFVFKDPNPANCTEILKTEGQLPRTRDNLICYKGSIIMLVYQISSD